jgi:hypothetical protein
MIMDYLLAILAEPALQIVFMFGVLSGMGLLSLTRMISDTIHASVDTTADTDSDTSDMVSEESDPDYEPPADEDDADNARDLAQNVNTFKCLSGMTVKQLRRATSKGSRDRAFTMGYRNKDQLIYALMIDLCSDKDIKLPVAVAARLRKSTFQDLCEIIMMRNI